MYDYRCGLMPGSLLVTYPNCYTLYKVVTSLVDYVVPELGAALYK